MSKASENWGFMSPRAVALNNEEVTQKHNTLRKNPSRTASPAHMSGSRIRTGSSLAAVEKRFGTVSRASFDLRRRRLGDGRSRHSMQDTTLTHRTNRSSQGNQTTEDVSEIREWCTRCTTRFSGCTTGKRKTAARFQSGGVTVYPQTQSVAVKREREGVKSSLQCEKSRLQVHRRTTPVRTPRRMAVSGGAPDFSTVHQGAPLSAFCHEVVA